jgi:hypothetical protein
MCARLRECVSVLLSDYIGVWVHLSVPLSLSLSLCACVCPWGAGGWGTKVPLHAHLEQQGVEFLQFAFRWMNCLLMREVSLNNTIRMWDTYMVRHTATHSKRERETGTREQRRYARACISVCMLVFARTCVHADDADMIHAMC